MGTRDSLGFFVNFAQCEWACRFGRFKEAHLKVGKNWKESCEFGKKVHLN